MINRSKTFKGQYKYLIFDFDGTINDTEPGIDFTFKKVVEKMQITYTKPNFKPYIGPPLEHSFRDLAGDDRWQEGVSLYREIFDQNNCLEMSRLYDGMDRVLATLCKKYPLAIASCKFEPHLLESVESKGVASFFQCICGQYGDAVGKAEVLENVLKKTGWNKHECILIGDTKYDMEGAAKVGMDVVAVTYGFGTRQELAEYNPNATVDTALELIELFEN